MTLELPHARDSEACLLGLALLSPAVVADVAGTVDAADFSHPAHGAIWAAMADLDGAGKAIDAVSVEARMGERGDGLKLRVLGSGYFGELMSAAIAPAGAPWHARRIASKAHRRRWILAAQSIAAAGYGDTEDEMFVEDAEKAALELSTRKRTDGPVHIRTGVKALVADLDRRYNSRETVTGARSGFDSLDAITGGFLPSKLYVVAARPAMGKTAWALRVAMNAGALVTPAGQPEPVASLGFSLEMALDEITARAVSGEGLINGEILRCGKLLQADWLRLTKTASRLHDLPVYLDDAPSPTLADMRAKARRWRANPAEGGATPKALIWVDYLQLVRASRKSRDGNREREVAEVAEGLKDLAKELRLPVIALAQLSRRCEERTDKRPLLSDLRESGAIEQSADFVAFLYREEVYNATTTRGGIADLFVSKHRAGRTGKIAMRWRPEFTRFDDMEQER